MDFWIKFYEFKNWVRYNPVLKRLMNGWYWFRSHTYNRYHIINISGQDGYKWGWIDRDHAMYLACFALLIDFVEKEDLTVGLRTMKEYCSNDMWNKEDRKVHMQNVRSQLKVEKEIRFLYNWWKTERKKEHDEVEKILYDHHFGKDIKLIINDPSPKFKEWCKRTTELEEKDVKMLNRLMKVRQSLWT